MIAEVVTLKRANAKAPTLVNRNVPPRRVPNAAVRSREYLTSNEIEALMAAAKRSGRHGQRDATVILIAYRHGLRVSELVALRWDQIDLKQGTLHVNRLKNGSESVHPLRGPELRRHHASSPQKNLLVENLWNPETGSARNSAETAIFGKEVT